MQLDPEDMTSIINRAKRAYGHLGKVIAMMEQGADCEDVLTQLSAVLKALQRTGFATVSTGLKQCMQGRDEPDEESLARMQKLFLSLA